MIPADVKKNNLYRVWQKMSDAELDVDHVVERWERKPHANDTPAVFDENGNCISRAKYFGEWIDKTEEYALRWEIKEAQTQIDKHERLINLRLNMENEWI